MTSHAVRRLLAEGVLVRLRRGVLVGSCVLERAADDPALGHRLSLTALLLTYDDAGASHESAAALLGLPLLRRPDRPVTTRAQGAWRGGSDSRVRVAPLPPHHLTEVDGLRCTTPARTVVDVARTMPFRDAVVVGDAALRDRCTRHELWSMADECASWADLGRARIALAFLDGRSESPLESVSRAIMHERQLPPPEPQYEIEVEGETYRVDFYWKESRTVGEADGRGKYSMDPALTPAEVAWLEKLREDQLRDAGYRVVRWTYGQMLGSTDETIARIRRRLTPRQIFD